MSDVSSGSIGDTGVPSASPAAAPCGATASTDVATAAGGTVTANAATVSANGTATANAATVSANGTATVNGTATANAATVSANGTAASPAASGAARRRKATAARKRSSGRRLFAFDRRLGVRWVAGADEAGRGCLAGPLVAAAVLFDTEALTTRELRALSRLNDSKQHTIEVREELYPIVLRTAAKVCVVSRCAPGIDARGLHKTNLAALRDALLGVARPGCICLSDGFAVGQIPYDQRAIVEGDATSAAIAAASIVAKVTRDRYMHRADAMHPGWEFASHVGYSTPEHRDAIQRLGVSPLHRLSFQSTAYQQLALT